jgi:RHS repeat-associated protein
MTYASGGLLASFERPNGAVSTLTYDPEGRLVRDANDAGGFWDIVRTDQPASDYQVSMSSAEGRTTTYDLDFSSGLQRTTIYPDGTSSLTAYQSNTQNTVTEANGTVTTNKSNIEYRLRGASVFPETSTALPSGLVLNERFRRDTQLNDLNDPLSIRGQQISEVRNNKTWYTQYDAPSRTYTRYTPLLRTTTTIIDDMRRPLSITETGLATQYLTYDARGRIISTVQGLGADERLETYAYNTAGWLDSVTDGLNRITLFDYDLAGRLVSLTMPDGRAIDYTYDLNGNTTSITPPGRSAHVFTYTSIDQEASYDPPPLTAGSTVTNYIYSLDKELLQVLRPDGNSIDYNYDAGGRLSDVTTPRGVTSYTYSPVTGQLAAINAPGAEGLAFTYDGHLPVTETWSGTVNGDVDMSYDNNFLVTVISVDGTSIGLTYDNDELLTQAGNFSLTRSTQNSLLTDTDIGSISTGYGYNTVGELTSASTVAGTTGLYSVNYTRDLIGRIASKTETIEGQTTTYDYTYDLAGRLIEVSKDNVVVSTYSYDSNSNRTGGTTVSGPIAATYDAQDRLTSYNGVAYAYTTAGDLLSRNESGLTTFFDYDVMGNLTHVSLPGGMQIDYVIDGRDRRIGKQVDGVLVQGFLYQDQLNPVAELDGNNNVVSRFVYGDKPNVPAYMIKGGVTYRIISDHLGSPRLVVNTGDGSIAQQMDYDEFGRVIQDTNPGFQPFGFAGGIYDLHTGLIRFGARDYDAETGRWTRKDPIGFEGGDANLYGYVVNDPINFIDPNGLRGMAPIRPPGTPGYRRDLHEALENFNDPRPYWRPYMANPGFGCHCPTMSIRDLTNEPADYDEGQNSCRPKRPRHYDTPSMCGCE